MIFFKKTKEKIDNLNNEVHRLKSLAKENRVLFNWLEKIIYCLNQIATMEEVCSSPNPTSRYYNTVRNWTRRLLSKDPKTLEEPMSIFKIEMDKYIPLDWLRKRG